MLLDRRAAGLGLTAALLAPFTRARAQADPIAAIEGRVGGRVGVAVAGRGRAPGLAYRADERFPMCSTFKTLAAACVLARVEAGEEELDRAMTYGRADLDTYAPVAEARLEENGGHGRMTLAEACAAAVMWSDNTAANLMLRALRGPDALTAWLRGIGDGTTRLDRSEPDLNTAIPGDPRDTTTPAAMLASLDAILLGPVLGPDSRARLEGWMVEARTGGRRLRAGLPPAWGVGDKTGTGANGTANVTALLRPPGRPPLVACVYITGARAEPEALNAAHAEIGRLIAALPAEAFARAPG